MSTIGCAATVSERILAGVERRVGGDRFRRFFGGLVEVSVGDDEVRVLAASDFAAERLSRRFGEAVRGAAQEATGDDAVAVRIGTRPAAPPTAGATSSGVAALGSPRRRPLTPTRRRRRGALRSENPAQTLDSFVVGPCNELAHCAAVAFAKPEHPIGHGVLFLHGECGVGKTHLLKGIAERFLRDTPGARVRYTTGEAFTNAYLAALRGGDVEAFRRRHRGLDLLCLDDVHFLANKTHTQTEFLHTFDAMDLDGARLALASDESPARIGRFSRELVSRFSAGMVAGMRTPDPATRRRVIESMARRRGMALSDDGVTALAERCAGSAREIDGALTRIDAVRTLLPMGRAFGPTLDAAAVRAALGPDFERGRARPVRVDVIVETTAEALGVTVPEMLGVSRRRRVVVARSIAAHLARKIAGRSFQEIADALGRSTHSTVFTACKRVESKIAQREAVDAGPDLAVQTWADLAGELEQRIRAASRRV